MKICQLECTNAMYIKWNTKCVHVCTTCLTNIKLSQNIIRIWNINQKKLVTHDLDNVPQKLLNLDLGIYCITQSNIIPQFLFGIQLNILRGSLLTGRHQYKNGCLVAILDYQSD